MRLKVNFLPKELHECSFFYQISINTGGFKSYWPVLECAEGASTVAIFLGMHPEFRRKQSGA
jgi:hypothetical protein